MRILSLIIYACQLGNAISSLPKLSISIKDGSYAGVYGLDPTASWSNNNRVGDFDVGYGIETNIRATKDIASLPKNIWGKVSSKIGDWGLSAKAKVQGIDVSNGSIEIDTNNSEEELSFHLKGTYGNDGFTLQEVEANKSFESDGAKLTLTPNYNIQSEEATVVMSYEKDGTGIEVEASKDVQTFTLSRQLDEENRVSPTLSNTGDISVAWEHRIDDDKTVTTTFKPEEFLDIEFEESGWNANIFMPFDGKDIDGVSISIKKDVTF
mmetsp:Transcript_25444/g.29474  ORF Transcript_25444/g.29474 Transcript_25444/m.29474 type:complete len:266 (-) Transcript_25444:4018-4815(-)